MLVVCGSEQEEQSVLRAAMVSLSGEMSEPATLAQCDNYSHTQRSVSAIWDGETFDVFLLCRQEGDFAELRLLRIGSQPEVFATEHLLDRWDSEYHGAMAATWNGTDIALVWSATNQYGSSHQTYFSIVATEGEPSLVSAENVQVSLRFKPRLIWHGNGYLLMTSDFCLTCSEYVDGVRLCAFDAEGRLLEPCRISDVMLFGTPTDLSAVNRRGGATVFFEEQDHLWYGAKRGICWIPWAAPDQLLTSPEPIRRPASDLYPLGLSCTEHTCHALSLAAEPHVLTASWESWIRGKLQMFNTAHDSGAVGVQDVRFDQAPRITYGATASSPGGRIGLVWAGRVDDGYYWLSLIGPDGNVLWRQGLSDATAHFRSSESLHPEGAGFRLFYKTEPPYRWFHLFANEQVDSDAELAHTGDLKQITGTEGIYLS